jgi:hypothetical protein
MKLVNLTPHTLHIHSYDGAEVTALPSEGSARCAVFEEQIGDVNNTIPIYATRYGEIDGLPDPQEGTAYVVSLLVRQSLPERKDLLSPGQLIRDDEGKVIGCKGLAANN